MRFSGQRTIHWDRTISIVTKPNFERTMLKIEVSDMELSSENMHSMHNAENVASSSGSNLRSSFIAMGFAQSLVNRVIEEKGEDDADLILETLFAYSARQNP